MAQRKWKTAVAGIGMVGVTAGLIAGCSSDSGGENGDGEVTITVALAANPQMQTAESLIADFEEKNPGINVEFTVLPENELRPAVTKDVSTNAGQYDVAMIGSYEVPIWAERGWIIPLDEYASADTDWDEADLLEPIKNIVSDDGTLFAAPFYGSSSFLMYRKDLAEAAGVTISESPTWDEIRAAAEAMDDEEAGISGICLRGLPGWGQNLAAITTVINTFGGQWFNEAWETELTMPETEEAVDFYVDLLRDYGQPDAAASGWEGCLQSFSQGQSAMWYDDTVFAGSAIDQAASPEIADNIAFAMAPTGPADIPSGWLWSWGLAVTKSSQNPDAAWKFISWATSKDYIQLAGENAGWDAIPPDSRHSTYEIPEYLEAADRYADLTIQSIEAANPLQPTVNPVPYTGVQYVQIPEFVEIGDYVSQQLAGAISGAQSVDDALAASEEFTSNIIEEAGYGQ